MFLCFAFFLPLLLLLLTEAQLPLSGLFRSLVAYLTPSTFNPSHPFSRGSLMCKTQIWPRGSRCSAAQKSNFQQWKQCPPSLGPCLCLPVSLPPISHLSVQMPPSRNPGVLVISLFFYADFTFGKPPLTGSLLILHWGRPVTPSQSDPAILKRLNLSATPPSSTILLYSSGKDNSYESCYPQYLKYCLVCWESIHFLLVGSPWKHHGYSGVLASSR